MPNLCTFEQLRSYRIIENFSRRIGVTKQNETKIGREKQAATLPRGRTEPNRSPGRIYPHNLFPSIKIQSRRITMTKLSPGQEYLTPFVGDCDRNSGLLCIFRTVQGPHGCAVLPFVRPPSSLPPLFSSLFFAFLSEKWKKRNHFRQRVKFHPHRLTSKDKRRTCVSAWFLGWFMCKAVAYIQGVSVAASVYSLVAVSLDRYVLARIVQWTFQRMISSSVRRHSASSIRVESCFHESLCYS